jgi:hypothetical protein
MGDRSKVWHQGNVSTRRVEQDLDPTLAIKAVCVAKAEVGGAAEPLDPLGGNRWADKTTKHGAHASRHGRLCRVVETTELGRGMRLPPERQ